MATSAALEPSEATGEEGAGVSKAEEDTETQEEHKAQDFCVESILIYYAALVCTLNRTH